MHQSVWAAWVKRERLFLSANTPNTVISFERKSSRSGKGQVQDQYTATHQTVHPAMAPQHFTVVACCIPHAAAHGPLKGMSAPFFKPEYFKGQIHKCHLNRVESIWPSDTKAANPFERPLGSGPKHAEVK